MNIPLTALTRPRISCGGGELRDSSAHVHADHVRGPSAASAAIDSGKLRDAPNTIVAIPNSATQANILRPDFSRIGA